MPILLTRIDDRLIHGQVVVGWVQTLKANHIAVVNDEAVNNDMQKFLFRMATPPDIKLSILTVMEAAGKIKKREFDEMETIILLNSPEDAVKLVQAGGKLSEINIGGMHFSPSKVQLFDAIFVDEQDIAAFNELKKMGVGLEVRMVPTEAKKDIFKAIEEIHHKGKGK